MHKNKWSSIADIAGDINSGAFRAVDMVDRSLAIIEENKEYQSLISVLSESAHKKAVEIDRRVKSGEHVGRLAGVPFIAKDNFLTFTGETTAASNILKNFRAPYQATAINKLEAEGAICVAKANLDSFAHGSSTENSDFFTTKNPYDKTRVPGGSSGGSAASVALDIAPFALGTDTGGSIRQPASFCGVVGFKPTYGLISRSGVVAMGSSLDVVGPLTRSVKDAGLLLDILKGKDELDSTSIESENENFSKLDTKDLKGRKFGLVKEYIEEGIDAEIKKATLSKVEEIKRTGGEVVEVSLPSLSLALATYYIICPAEVSSNLSRYDGQRFGYSDGRAKSLDESYEMSRSVGFGDETKRRIIMGTFVLSSGYYDAYYQKAQMVRSKIISEFNQAFKKVDFLVGPTAPTTAFKIGENTKDPLRMYMSDALTVGASLAGIPAISLPNGESPVGLPIGFQIMAPARNDKKLLEVANILERRE